MQPQVWGWGEVSGRSCCQEPGALPRGPSERERGSPWAGGTAGLPTGAVDQPGRGPWESKIGGEGGGLTHAGRKKTSLDNSHTQCRI